MKALLISLLIKYLPDIVDLIIHAAQELAHRNDNNLNDMDVAKLIENKDALVTEVRRNKHKKR